MKKIIFSQTPSNAPKDDIPSTERTEKTEETNKNDCFTNTLTIETQKTQPSPFNKNNDVIEMPKIPKKKAKTTQNNKLPLSLKSIDQKFTLKKTVLQTDSKLSLLVFFLMKVIFPMIFFALVIISLIYLQIYVNDFCFVPHLCNCNHILIYIYSGFREFLQYDALLIAWAYFLSCYVTNRFFNRNFIKFLFFLVQISVFLLEFVISNDKKNEDYLSNFRQMRAILTMTATCGFNVLLIIMMRRKLYLYNYFKSFMKIGLFTGFFFFHGLYMKTTISFILLQFLLRNYEINHAKNLFKLIWLTYYIIYNYIANFFIYSFYKDYLEEANFFPFEMIVTVTKFIMIDVISIQIMNVLTIPLNDVFSWISLFNYLYFLISIYCGWSFFISGWRKFKKILKIKRKNSNDKYLVNAWKELKSGCIFEANVIIFMRIFIYWVFLHFFYITKIRPLFTDCTLEASSFVGGLLAPNLFLIAVSHTAIVVVILFFMWKKKKFLINVIVEDYPLAIRAIFFIMYYAQVDVTIQFYMYLGLIH